MNPLTFTFGVYKINIDYGLIIIKLFENSFILLLLLLTCYSYIPVPLTSLICFTVSILQYCPMITLYQDAAPDVCAFFNTYSNQRRNNLARTFDIFWVRNLYMCLGQFFWIYTDNTIAAKYKLYGALVF